MIESFKNTEIAFNSKSDKDLKRAYFLFKIIEKPWVVKFCGNLLNFAIKTNLPVSWILKPTIFKHFCGGETINESEKTLNDLAKSNIFSILDYSAEGNQNEADFDKVRSEILKVIEKSKTNRNIPFAVFKATGLARLALLEKINAGKTLTDDEKFEFSRVIDRIDSICNAGCNANTPVLIDAEESWIQQPIDDIVSDMMKKYNTNAAIVYNTLQMYRHDRIEFLHNTIENARKEKYFIGLKLVRGAYLEQENERAVQMRYPTPVHNNKDATDTDYDNALTICVDNADIVSVCSGSHNEDSNAHLVKLINEKQFKINDSRFWFAQLLGMSDHISYNLAKEGFNVAKYVPYGPVKTVMPYLIRRAQENTSIAGQTGRELSLIKEELKRRKLSK
ncbi:MAG: proline dehydrogenase family protein [Bacteroidetes bacterium]|nr:proline dehydrogenase family protein [Bacteroidota bacterium]